MDRSSAVGQLPVPQSVAIRLRDDGHGDQLIAVALRIDAAEVPALVQVAERNLRTLMTMEFVKPARSGRSGRPRGVPVTTGASERGTS